jgi:hypothetical protein
MNAALLLDTAAALFPPARVQWPAASPTLFDKMVGLMLNECSALYTKAYTAQAK